MWGALYLLERSMDRDIWRFDAPYPCRSMLEDIDEQVEIHSRQTNHVKQAEASVLDAWERPVTA
jgi:hypothetical protein